MLHHLKRVRHVRDWHPKKWHIAAAIGVVILAQFLFPTDHLLPFAEVEGMGVGGWGKKAVTDHINSILAEKKIPVHRGNEPGIYLQAKATQIGLKINTSNAIQAMGYPWYMRLVPTSLLWYGFFQDPGEYTHTIDEKKTQFFIKNELSDCNLQPQNATLKYVGKKLVVDQAISGAKCKPEDVISAVKKLAPTIQQPASLTFPATITPASISGSDDEKVKNDLETRQPDIDITIRTDKVMTLPYETLLPWIKFDNAGDTLTYSLDSIKLDEYLQKDIAPLVATQPGVTKITTKDFTVLSQQNGTPGTALDLSKTRESIVKVLRGEEDSAKPLLTNIPPRVEYTRTYSSSDAGLSALVKQFAEDNPGTYGVQYIELAGQKRRAEYQADKQFTTASTYKLFVAYSTLKRIESGQWSWEDQSAGGQSTAVCFDKMIVNSDNPCAEALYKRIGYTTTINEARALGLTHTSIDSESQKTSAGDLATLLGGVYSGTIDLSASSRGRLIDAMKRNVYRQGIPAGTNGTVADKVGFLDGLLHDASIVYSPRGDYVLVVMTDGSSWAKIAELTRKIEQIRG